MSNTTKHTPGPWIVNEDADSIWVEPTSSLCNPICVIFARKTSNYNPPEFQDEDYANARIIAAALELLEALENIVKRFGTGPNEEDDRDVMCKIWVNKNEIAQARAAIKKAKP